MLSPSQTARGRFAGSRWCRQWPWPQPWGALRGPVAGIGPPGGNEMNVVCAWKGACVGLRVHVRATATVSCARPTSFHPAPAPWEGSAGTRRWPQVLPAGASWGAQLSPQCGCVCPRLPEDPDCEGPSCVARDLCLLGFDPPTPTPPGPPQSPFLLRAALPVRVPVCASARLAPAPTRFQRPRRFPDFPESSPLAPQRCP